MTGKWGEIQRKLDSVRVSGEFELSRFCCSRKWIHKLCNNYYYRRKFDTSNGLNGTSTASSKLEDFPSK